MDAARRAYKKLAATSKSDRDWIHPEELVLHVSRREAYCFQAWLRDMNEEQRLAARADALASTSYEAPKFALTASLIGERDAERVRHMRGNQDLADDFGMESVSSRRGH
jgi:hypothetical protein